MRAPAVPLVSNSRANDMPPAGKASMIGGLGKMKQGSDYMELQNTLSALMIKKQNVSGTEALRLLTHDTCL